MIPPIGYSFNFGIFMGKKNIIAALILIGFGLFYGYQITHIPTRTLPNSPDPSFFPWVLTTVLLILSCALLIQGFKASQQGAEILKAAPTDHTQKKDVLDKPNPIARPLACLGIFILYLAALPWLGFLAASVPFFAGMVMIFGEQRKRWWIPFSLGVPIFLFILFQYLLRIPLPRTEIFG